MLKFIRALRMKYRYAREDHAWTRSPRRAELEAECDLPPRQLTEEEAGLLRWMLEHGSESARSFLPQLDELQAVRDCTCGCPSIRFVVAEDVSRIQSARDRMVCDLLRYTAKNELVGVILWQAGGKLSSLEIWSMDGQIDQDGTEFSLPVPESLYS